MSEIDSNELERREPKAPTEGQLRIARYVDGVLDPTDRAAFEAECASDPDLRQAVAEAEQLRSWFVPGRAEVAPTPGPRFADRVAAAVLADAVRSSAVPAAPHRSEDALALRFARRLAWSAAAVLLVGVVVWSGILQMPGHGPLEASTQEVRDAMQELDRRSAERLQVTPVGGGGERADERR